MAVNNPFTIIYSDNLGSPATGETVGGTSDIYQLLGPYIFDQSFGSLRLVFDVVEWGQGEDFDGNGEVGNCHNSTNCTVRHRRTGSGVHAPGLQPALRLMESPMTDR